MRATMLGGRFTPRRLGGCRLWIAADRGVTQSSNLISTHADNSGAGNDGTASVTARQPTYTAPSSGSPALVTFDGVKNALSMDNALTTGAGAFSVGMLYKLSSVPTVSGTFWHTLFLKTSTAPAYFNLFFTSVAGNPSYTRINWTGQCDSSSANVVGISPTLDTNWHRLVITYNGSGRTTTTNYAVLYDGNSNTVLSSYTDVLGGTNRGGWGGLNQSSTDPTYCTPCVMKQLCAYNRQLNSAEMARLDRWLATRL